MTDLRTVLFRECREQVRATLETQPGQQAALREHLEAAQSTWPTVEVEPADFVAHLAARVPPDGHWPTLHTADLYLAAGATLGLPTALAAFEAAWFGDIRPVARRAWANVDLDDLRQELRTHLFVSTEERAPRIAAYDGRGELRNWFRVVVMRTALNRRRRIQGRRTFSADEDLLDSVLPASSGAELEPYKEGYAAAVRGAVTVAIGQLEVGDRLVLRYSVIDRLSLVDIGALLGVHKSSAHRRVAQARTRLFDASRRELQRALDVHGAELDAVIALALSRVELSLSRILTP